MAQAILPLHQTPTHTTLVNIPCQTSISQPSSTPSNPKHAPSPTTTDTTMTKPKPNAVITYFKKWKGSGTGLYPPAPPLPSILYAWLASFIAIASLAALQYDTDGEHNDTVTMLIPSFGATAALVYGCLDSPLSTPRNVFFGHLISAATGLVCTGIAQAILHASSSSPDPMHMVELGREWVWLVAGLSVSTSIALMLATRTMHPPGGATACVVALTLTSTPSASKTFSNWPWTVGKAFLFLACPVITGILIQLFVGLLVNNISTKRTNRRYPPYWLCPKKKGEDKVVLADKKAEGRDEEERVGAGAGMGGLLAQAGRTASQQRDVSTSSSETERDQEKDDMEVHEEAQTAEYWRRRCEDAERRLEELERRLSE
ncbi:hypothetical protein SAICODRAFT_31679 [Saitoella complicata NRRL Y-17804]|uniref:HPP transmembrane region domain-containing protein n=1 Tax=Saitoella complicata (strain BCRC 22490 / CBS 7301 / JCM 7358 / NBRC 10748 / NRRL Y-17804) TaxID=698492 RepID=A0A0E9NF44_SAICN|nr:uncharacterized protein SAICODRAFT_31679 [Saitoella complicata NRRL Y-17804]ODQ50931.1 hypothetical protein SAICODRAFT_31679 [Saitoella complicata NRRL Y-17804]GAO48428.1 hypothetical protein G7K_2601-t1 [Saitoella complicata NRRL Y-17804]